jgi:phosphoribosylanthranilate isomerase
MEPLFIKICGVTNGEDALYAAEQGAEAIGFNFFPHSKRFISPAMAGAINRGLKATIMRVGVFVNPDRGYVNDVIREVGLEAIQFSGNETPESVSRYRAKVFKAIHVLSVDSIDEMKLFNADAFLLDTHRDGEFGGTGKTFDWDLARKAKQFGKVILAGGLTPDNVADAVRLVRPYGVDVSSGVELRPGIKDHKKIKDFIRRATEAHVAPSK